MKTRYRTQQVGFLNKRTIIVLQVLQAAVEMLERKT